MPNSCYSNITYRRTKALSSDSVNDKAEDDEGEHKYDYNQY